MLDRILITAAHGTGKTTLVNALYARLSTAEGGGGGTKWTLVEEIARRLMAQDGWTEEDVAKVRPLLFFSPFPSGTAHSPLPPFIARMAASSHFGTASCRRRNKPAILGGPLHRWFPCLSSFSPQLQLTKYSPAQLDPITYTLLHHPSTDDHIRLLRSPDVLSLLQFYRQPEKTLIIHLLPVEEYAIPDPGVRPAYASLAEFEKTSEAFAAVLKESGVKWKSIGRETRDLEARVDKVVSWVEQRMV